MADRTARTDRSTGAAPAAASPGPVDTGGIAPDVYARRWAILGLLCTSLIIVIVGNTSLNVALPRLADDLKASTSELQWMVDSYSLVFAGMLLTAGALGDRYGRKGALQVGLVLFALGALAAAFADGSAQIIGARALMGFGGAFVMPSTLSILTNVFPPHERAKAIAIWAGVSGAGAAVGPIASGFLLEHFWWGSVFLVNLPIILTALVLGRGLLPKSSDPTGAPLDFVGAGLSIVGLAALVYAIIEAPNHGWGSAATIGWFVAAAVVLGLFALWERSRDEPMLNLHFFADRRFSVSSGGITLIFFSMFGTLFLMTQYFQLVLGYSPLEAGVRLLPMSVVMATLAPQTPKLVVRFGANRVGGGGLATLAVGLATLALVGTDTSYLQLTVTLMVMAAGMALTMSPLTAQLMSSVPPAKAGVGSAMNDTTRELGGALGVALLGSLVTSRYAASIGDALSGVAEPVREIARSGLAGAVSLADDPERFGDLPIDAATARQIKAAGQDAFVDGLSLSAIVAAVVVAIGAVVVHRLLPSGLDRGAGSVAAGGPGEGTGRGPTAGPAGDQGSGGPVGPRVEEGLATR
jgi:EmrB/QacA subfamily drug resistance transporter